MEGEGFTLNGWDRAERAGGEGQTEMLQEERQMEEDGCQLDGVGGGGYGADVVSEAFCQAES